MMKIVRRILSRRFKTAALRPRMESVGISPKGQAGKKPRALARGASFLLFAICYLPFAICRAQPTDTDSQSRQQDTCLPDKRVTAGQEEKIQKARVYYLSGKSLSQQGKYAAADEEFKKAQQLLDGSRLTLSPPEKISRPSPALNALEAAKIGNIQEALSLYIKAIELSPRDANLHYNLALVYIKTESFKEAAQEFRKTLELNPKDKFACYNLGVLYESYLGDKKKAIDYYARYVKFASPQEETGEVREWIHQLKKELKEK